MEVNVNTKDNSRSKHTKQVIQSVFLSVLESKEISKITVQEICRLADINRSTFYSHYLDVRDLFGQIEEVMTQSIAKVFYDFEKEEHKPFNYNRYVELLYYIQKNRSFYQIYLNDPSGKNSINIHMTESGRKLLEEKDFYEGAAQRNVMEYRLEYYRAGLNAIIRRWLNLGCPETPEELAAIITQDNNLNLSFAPSE